MSGALYYITKSAQTLINALFVTKPEREVQTQQLVLLTHDSCFYLNENRMQF